MHNMVLFSRKMVPVSGGRFLECSDVDFDSWRRGKDVILRILGGKVGR